MKTLTPDFHSKMWWLQLAIALAVFATVLGFLAGMTGCASAPGMAMQHHEHGH